eukprot:357482-Chlamydomonas_euryale.AAC.5
MPPERADFMLPPLSFHHMPPERADFMLPPLSLTACKGSLWAGLHPVSRLVPSWGLHPARLRHASALRSCANTTTGMHPPVLRAMHMQKAAQPGARHSSEAPARAAGHSSFVKVVRYGPAFPVFRLSRLCVGTRRYGAVPLVGYRTAGSSVHCGLEGLEDRHRLSV